MFIASMVPTFPGPNPPSDAPYEAYFAIYSSTSLVGFAHVAAYMLPTAVADNATYTPDALLVARPRVVIFEGYRRQGFGSQTLRILTDWALTPCERSGLGCSVVNVVTHTTCERVVDLVRSKMDWPDEATVQPVKKDAPRETHWNIYADRWGLDTELEINFGWFETPW